MRFERTTPGTPATPGIRPGAGRCGAAVLALALVSVACFRDPVAVTTEQETVALVGVVRAGADSVSVLLARLSREGVVRPEPGAVLTLRAPGGDAPLVEAPPAACGLTEDHTCLRAGLPRPVAPGEVVRLSGRLADGTDVGASTTVPRPVPLSAPGGGPLPDTLRYGQLHEIAVGIPAGWSGYLDGGAVRGVAIVEGDARVCRFEPQEGAFTVYRVRPGVLALPVTPPLCDPPLLPGWQTLLVDAEVRTYDPAFSAYRRLGPVHPAFLDEAVGDLRGVEGVFGSVVARTIHLRVDR